MIRYIGGRQAGCQSLDLFVVEDEKEIILVCGTDELSLVRPAVRPLLTVPKFGAKEIAIDRRILWLVIGLVLQYTVYSTVLLS